MESIPIADKIPELDIAIQAAKEAGNAILEIYQENFKISKKSDDSPITEADLKSNEIIKEILSQIERTVDLIGNITHDIQGSLAGLEETSGAMEGISSSTEQQTASMEEVTSTANKLGSLAEELKSELDMFVISEKTEISNVVVKPIEKSKIVVEN